MSHHALYIVATPIGNLADMVPRAIEVLQTVDVIAAEDTRHTAKLLAYFNIQTPMLAYHDHSDDSRTAAIISRLKAGESVGLVSDAGTPLISDPGYALVRQAREAGIRVVPIPGACALVAALSAAGMPSDRFAFEGFLPSKAGARERALEAVAGMTHTLIFYEAPHRILASLQAMAAVFGAEREVVVARELTKTFETFLAGTMADVIALVEGDSNQQRGEFVVMVRGVPARAELAIGDESARIMKILAAELPLKQASQLAAQITGVKKKALYQWALDQDKSQG